MGCQIYYHKLTKRDIVSIVDYAKTCDAYNVQLVKGGNGEYSYNVNYTAPHNPASSVYLYLSYEELIDISNNIRDLDDSEKIQISQTITPIGYVTKLTTKKKDDIDVTDYSIW